MRGKSRRSGVQLPLTNFSSNCMFATNVVRHVSTWALVSDLYSNADLKFSLILINAWHHIPTCLVISEKIILHSDVERSDLAQSPWKSKEELCTFPHMHLWSFHDSRLLINICFFPCFHVFYIFHILWGSMEIIIFKGYVQLWVTCTKFQLRWNVGFHSLFLAEENC